MKKKKNFEQKWIRPNMVLEYLIFLALKVRALRGRRRKREEKKKEKKKRREEEKKKKSRFGSLEFLFENFLFMFRTLVWNFCMDLLVRKPS